MNELTINNWQQFSAMADFLDVGPPAMQTYAFRGHAAAHWPLKPSFLRRLGPPGATETKALELEVHALTEFRSQAHHHVSASELATTTDTISWWTLMQHHGAPTRLLDWTASIYVAAYFAVIDRLETDGAIWLVHTQTLRELMAKEHGEQNMPEREKEIANNFQKPGAPAVVLFAGRRNKSQRMIAQQGFFSISRNVLCDHGEVFSHAFEGKSEKEVYRKVVIPAEQKPAFARKLRSMNISANSLFPGLDGLARSVGELVQLGLN